MALFSASLLVASVVAAIFSEAAVGGNAKRHVGGVMAAAGYQVDPSTIFKVSVQYLDTKDFVYNIASGTAGDLSSSAGTAGTTAPHTLLPRHTNPVPAPSSKRSARPVRRWPRFPAGC
jgi:hypothetical protein